MTAAGSWDRGLFTPAEEPHDSPGGGMNLAWLRPSVDELITLILLITALLAVVISIERANWVREMPSLPAAAFIGLMTGWLLARSPIRGRWLHPIGIPIGVAVVFAMVLQTMRLVNPLAEGGVRERWSEVWVRNDAWFDALVTGGVSNDPLPFVLLVVFAAWALSYIAAWAVFRWHNPWMALVPGGVAMLTNISYLPGQPSAEFIVFLFAAILLFTRMHLQRTVAGWAGQRVALPQYLSFQVLHLATWIGLALITVAWLVPTGENWGPVSTVWDDALSPVSDRVDRVGQVFIGVDAKQDSVIHSFDSALPLQGKVDLGDELLFTVISPEPLYLHATAFDEYTPAGWRLSSTERQPVSATSVDAATFGTVDTRSQVRRPVVVEVQVENAPSDRRLLSAGEPLATDVEADIVTGGAGDDVVAMRPNDRIGSGDTYAAVGTVSAADIDRLLAAGVDYPDWVRERYLQLPEDLPAEIAQLASEIAGDSSNPYVAAVQIENYLRNNYAYTLEVDDPPPQTDAVAFFLFDAREGYFDHHASAMAVMLRTLGVPARVAVGYTLDEAAFDDVTKSYLVTEEESWTWPEVYFPNLGWVEFNPTPTRTKLARIADDSDLVEFFSDAELGTDAFDLLAETGLLPGGENGLPGGAVQTDEGEGSTFNAAWLMWLMALAAGVALVIVGGRAGWELAFRGMSPSTARWAKVQRLAGWAGLGIEPDDTPLETARSLRADLRYRGDIDSLARAYTRERYGPPHPDAEESGDTDPAEAERLDESYSGLRTRLLKETVRRLTGFRRQRDTAGGS